MTFQLRFAVSFTIIIFLATATQGQTWFVDDANCPSSGTGSQADPFCTIREGMDATMNGDIIIIVDGIYTGNGNKNLDFEGKAIVLRSANGAGSCIIDCEGDGRGFIFQSGETFTTILDGLTITGGFANTGAGILCLNFSSPTIRNCVIRNNSTPPLGGTAGGGLLLANGSPMLINCTITQNTSQYGGGIRLHDANPNIINCTINGNTAVSGGGIYANYNSNPIITNSIMWNNTARYGPEIRLYLSSTLTVSYSDVEGGQEAANVGINSQLIWGEGNINANPAFAFAEDPYLLSSSACIDVGTNNPLGGLLLTDRDGSSRPLDGHGDGISLADMGAHEYNAEKPSIALSRHKAEFFATVGRANPNDQVLSIRNCGGNILNWQIEPGCDWLQATPSSGTSTGEADEVSFQVDIAGLTHGKHICPLVILDQEAANGSLWMEVTLFLSSTLHVPTEYETIQAAINAALPSNDIVLVADGTYVGSGNKNLDFGGKVITVRSENGPENCIIDCEGDGRGFYFHTNEMPEAVVSGFTITNGLAQQGGGIYSYYSSPTITGCKIIANTASGIYFVGGNPSLTNCTISDNSSTWGGGIRFGDYSRSIITNCTITNNMATKGGGIFCTGFSKPTLINTILSGNSAAYGREIALFWDSDKYRCPSLTVSYSNVQQGQDSVYADVPRCTVNWLEGIIDADPLFINPSTSNYRLMPDSPCIDAGDNSVAMSPDLDGNLRIVDDPNTDDCPQPGAYCGTAPIVDMGAYEFGSVPCEPTYITSDPPNCAIDAGMTGADHVRPRWDRIDIMFPCNIELPTDLEFIVSTEPAGLTPIIVDVIQKNHFTVTLQLNESISPGVWTCFSHSSGSQACLGFHPSDTNGNLSADESDIVDIMHNLNGVHNPPMNLWQCDVNRSGHCNAIDILVTIDLLNGADGFTSSWKDHVLPMCPSLVP